jgi:hypothetical protein
VREKFGIVNPNFSLGLDRVVQIFKAVGNGSHFAF